MKAGERSGEEEEKTRAQGRRGERKRKRRVRMRIILKINWITTITSSGFPSNNKMKYYII